MPAVSWKIARDLVLVALAAFYLAGATEHASRVNTFKARGDQSGYLWDAENVYANWHGRNPPVLIGERNRMPLYAGYLALFYRPTISDPEFFLIGKQANIYLSLALLACLYLIFTRFLPPLPALNLLVVVAFGYFVFKAGYTQSELLFYFLFFGAFLMMILVLGARPDQPGLLWRAAAAGILAALAHLTKASVPPLVGIFLIVLAADALNRLRSDRRSARKLVAAVVAAVAFLAVLSPYLVDNKRAFGRYFYNVNTTFYVWYVQLAASQLRNDQARRRRGLAGNGRPRSCRARRGIGASIACGRSRTAWHTAYGAWSRARIACTGISST